MDTKKLRQKILDLAIHGKLVPQDPNDEPASVLLERIRAEKERLIAEGKIKRSKKSATSDTSHYENVPFEVSEGWCWRTLGDIGTWQAGGTPSRMHKEYYGGNIPWLKTGDLNDGIITSIPEYITEEGLNNSSAKLNPKGSVLIAMYGATIGKIGILGMPATTNQACCACINYEGIIQKYLFYFLLSHKDEFIALGGGGAQPNISKDIIVKTLIPIPPINEQERIVSKIDELLILLKSLDANKDALEATLEQAKSKILDLAIHGKLVPQDANDEPASELLKRINPKAVASCDNPHYGRLPEKWSWIKLGQLFNIVSAKRVTKDQWKSHGVPFYRTREIVQLSQNGYVDNVLYIDIEHYESLRNKYGIPKSGDIMLTAVGTIGKTYVVSQDDKFYYKDASVLCMRNEHNMNSQYISLAFSSALVQKQLYEKSKGTTVDTITIEKANNYIVPIPPIEEQSRIVAKVNELFSQLDMIEKSLQA